MFNGEYLISPWAIYLINMLHTIDIALVVLATVFALLTVTMLDIYFKSECNSIKTEKSKDKSAGLILMICFTAFLGCLFLLIITPSKETVIQMYVASLTTPDNIQAIKDMGISLTDFLKGNLIDIIREVKK